MCLVTVTGNDAISDHDAAEQLRDRTHGLTPVKPTALIVRRGNVAEEISRCAGAKDSGFLAADPKVLPNFATSPGIVSTMNVSLPESLKDFVDEQVTRRGYGGMLMRPSRTT